jgi:anti-sigma regulatory factor (Ser/Thr protein kinase)
VVQRWPRGPRSVGRARRLLFRKLSAWELEHVAETAELVVSELVTNAVRHTDSRRGHLIETRFERLAVGVRIEVHDACDARPVRREPTADDDAGRGLVLVDTLTGGMWGVGERQGVGKLVWAVCTDDAADGTSR